MWGGLTKAKIRNELTGGVSFFDNLSSKQSFYLIKFTAIGSPRAPQENQRKDYLRGISEVPGYVCR